jgi:hypothetical protein
MELVTGAISSLSGRATRVFQILRCVSLFHSGNANNSGPPNTGLSHQGFRQVIVFTRDNGGFFISQFVMKLESFFC